MPLCLPGPLLRLELKAMAQYVLYEPARYVPSMPWRHAHARAVLPYGSRRAPEKAEARFGSGSAYAPECSYRSFVPYTVSPYRLRRLTQAVPCAIPHCAVHCRPLCVVLGGAKVADKIGVVSALVEIADSVLVGWLHLG